MIRAVSSGVTVRLDSDFAPGAVAYVDADWIVPGAEVPALVAEGGALRWGEQEPMQAEVDGDHETAASQALAAVAAEAVEALGASGDNGVEVIGRGAIAECVRALLGRRLADGAERPSAVVDLTGDPETIRSATERVAPLGTVVLAGEPGGRNLALNLYPDVHARGLRLTGVGRPLSRPVQVADAAVGPPVRLAAGEAIDPAGRWFAVA